MVFIDLLCSGVVHASRKRESNWGPRTREERSSVSMSGLVGGGAPLEGNVKPRPPRSCWKRLLKIAAITVEIRSMHDNDIFVSALTSCCDYLWPLRKELPFKQDSFINICCFRWLQSRFNKSLKNFSQNGSRNFDSKVRVSRNIGIWLNLYLSNRPILHESIDNIYSKL